MNQDSLALKFRRTSQQKESSTSFSSRILRSHQSTTSLKRTPSAPVYPRSSHSGSRDHSRSRSNAQFPGSSSSSLEQTSGGPSPSHDESTGFFSGLASRARNRNSNRYSYHETDEITAPYETRGMLSALDENSAETTEPHSLKKPVLRSHYTSPPDTRGRHSLRQSASFTTLGQRKMDHDQFAHREIERAPDGDKRNSDDGNGSSVPRARHDRKTSFSRFVEKFRPSSSVKISAPENPVHVTHVGYDNQTGQFTGLPKEWQRLLQENGISKKEQEEHPQTMMDIMRFYEKNTRGDSDEEVWHKFDNAQPSNLGGTQSPTKSPRFPQNHEKSFENPRSPPPIPQGARSSNLARSSSSAQPKAPSSIPARSLSSGGMVAHRAPPRPPGPPSLSPSRAAPQAPVSKPYTSSPPQQNNYGPSFGTPTIPEAEPLQALPQRTPPSSRNGAPEPGAPGVIASPTQYQRQQEQVMAAAQRTLDQKHHERQQAQQPPAMSTATTAPAPDLSSPAVLPSSRAPPAARPRQRQRQSNINDVYARLLSICRPGDPTEIYYNLNKIGQGASGGVFTAYEHPKNNCVAIKQMNLDLQPKKDLIINEILVMKDSKHKNIVNFLDSFLHGLDLWVVMEYMEGGSLTDVVTFNIMSEGQIAAVCREVSARFLKFR